MFLYTRQKRQLQLYGMTIDISDNGRIELENTDIKGFKGCNQTRNLKIQTNEGLENTDK